MFTYELAKRLRAQRLPIVANALDPGIVDTELQRYLPTKARFCPHARPGVVGKGMP